MSEHVLAHVAASAAEVLGGGLSEVVLAQLVCADSSAATGHATGRPACHRWRAVTTCPTLCSIRPVSGWKLLTRVQTDFFVVRC